MLSQFSKASLMIVFEKAKKPTIKKKYTYVETPGITICLQTLQLLSEFFKP